jgi:hypothetical protein
MELIKTGYQSNKVLALHIKDTTSLQPERCAICGGIIDKRLGVYHRGEQSYCVQCFENSNPWRPAA